MAFKSIELFAGAGGLALGLEQAGFEHIGLVEFDRSAADTLIHNRPSWNVLCEDVEIVAARDLETEFGIKKGELDLLSGGAPCQSFSYAGKRLGLDDVRGTMFYHYATFLHKLQPKMFLFENVRGLLTHDKGRTYETIRNIFNDEGYTIQYQVLNAWDYGVPQKRERLITIGIRNDLVEKCSFNYPAKHDYKPLLKDIELETNPTECGKYSEYKANIFALVPPGGYWRDIDPDIAKEYMKRNNSTQWNENYPNKETIINDIENNIGYVLIVKNLIRGYIVVDFSDDEVYKNIKGKWKTFGNYASIHRCAIHKELRGQGYGSELFKFAEKLALSKNIRSVRVDTAPENETMKHLFNKNGYEYCGIVFIDGEKIAYEKLLTSNLEYK